MKYYIAGGTLAFIGAVTLLIVMSAMEPARMESFTQSYESRQIEQGALIFESSCRPCHGPQGEGTPLGSPLNRADLFNGEYLKAIGWSGTLDEFLNSTVSAGRPLPTEGTNFPQRMPTWSEVFGGPLRPDQIENVVAYVMNWGDRAVAAVQPTEITDDLMMGTDIFIELPEGDAEIGQSLAEGELGCAACHTLSTVGPPWVATDGLPGMAVRGDVRIQQDNYTGNATSGDEYLIESVVETNIHVVEGFQPDIMPTNFSERITLQDMAHLLAFMKTFE
ncbi:MAG: c-type cytochrome [Anaerolineales bacterium]